MTCIAIFMLVVETFLFYLPLKNHVTILTLLQDPLYMRTSLLRTWKSHDIPPDLFPYSRPQTRAII